MKQYNNLIQIFKYFKNNEICEKHLEKVRWNNEVVCPFCNSKVVYKTKLRYFCGDCDKRFNVKTKTIFENTKISLTKWFVSIYLSTSYKKGISSLQLSKDIDVTQKTAWFMLQRIREMLKDTTVNVLSGIVELDETYIGGKHKGKRGRGSENKIPIFGLLERQGKVINRKVENTKKKTLQSIINDKVKYGSEVMTDEWLAYNGLDNKYVHKVVNHSLKQYVSGDAHTNTIEGYWSLLKRGIIGIYHQVSDKHITRYLDEFVFRYNSRYMNEESRFDLSLGQCVVRLKYKDLIN
jgi:transposase-like protein